MNDTIVKEVSISRAPDVVWKSLTDQNPLADWMFPNSFEPNEGHVFTFQMPANPDAGFDGTVSCEVLECSPVTKLAFSWSGGPVQNTTVRYELVPQGDGGTLLKLEHSGFDTTQPWSEQAIGGAEYGWNTMLDKLAADLSS